MKKLISIGASLMLAVSAFATGNEGVNPPQVGTIVFNTGSGLVQSTNFAMAFQTPPVAVIFGSSTNTFTYTTTTTNITVTSGGGTGATNYTVGYSAYVGGTRLEYGTGTIATAATNVTFPNPYALAPVVILNGTTTNVLATTPTTTGFFVTNNASVATSAFTWISVGTVYNPASENTGQNPPSNKVIY